MGRPYPGHRVAVIDDDGHECPRGTPGDVALHRRDVHGERDPIFFLGYWKRDDATRAKFTGDPDDSWCRTGDTAVMDDDGYLWYQGRSDDVFKAAGYRIGPSEIENCLVKHAAVANAAVVPKPDAERGALVKAFVVLAPGFAGDAELVEPSCRRTCAASSRPTSTRRRSSSSTRLPMTTTGKVQRRVLRLREEEQSEGAAVGVTAPAPRRGASGLLDLAAQLAARVRGGVQVDVPEALLDLVDLRRRSASPSRRSGWRAVRRTARRRRHWRRAAPGRGSGRR